MFSQLLKHRAKILRRQADRPFLLGLTLPCWKRRFFERDAEPSQRQGAYDNSQDLGRNTSFIQHEAARSDNLFEEAFHKWLNHARTARQCRNGLWTR